MNKSQTATEYLIILAVVIVIALIVIGVLGGIPSIGGGTIDQTQKAILSSKPLAITNWAVDKVGTKIQFRNNFPNNIKLNNITISSKTISVDKILRPGESYTFFTPGAYENSVTKYEDKVVIDYTNLENNANYILSESDYEIIGKSSSGTGNLNSDLMEGLVGYWRFNGDFNDLSENGNDGTNYGVANYSDNVLNLDGSDSTFLDLGNEYESSLEGSPYFSFSAWVYPSSFSGYRKIIYSDTTDNNARIEVTISEDTGNLSFNLRSNEGPWGAWRTTELLVLNQWNYISLSWDGNSGIIISYVNGVKEELKNDHTGVIERQGTVKRAGLGYRPEQTSVWYLDPLKGKIDEVMIFNRALSESEIKQLYQAGR